MDKLINFRKTLGELKAFVATPIETNRDRAGVIQAFEFTFEQAWKSVQKIASDSGVQIGSPKAAFTFAMQNKMLTVADEPLWLQLLKDRNQTTHTYQEDLAREVLGRITKNYIRLFEGLLTALERELSKP
jgi:nucleotidyltransferase substrate binding protein (TIGR01987 family)